MQKQAGFALPADVIPTKCCVEGGHPGAAGYSPTSSAEGKPAGFCRVGGFPGGGVVCSASETSAKTAAALLNRPRHGQDAMCKKMSSVVLSGRRRAALPRVTPAQHREAAHLQGLVTLDPSDPPLVNPRSTPPSAMSSPTTVPASPSLSISASSVLRRLRSSGSTPADPSLQGLPSPLGGTAPPQDNAFAAPSPPLRAAERPPPPPLMAAPPAAARRREKLVVESYKDILRRNMWVPMWGASAEQEGRDDVQRRGGGTTCFFYIACVHQEGPSVSSLSVFEVECATAAPQHAASAQPDTTSAVGSHPSPEDGIAPPQPPQQHQGEDDSPHGVRRAASSSSSSSSSESTSPAEAAVQPPPPQRSPLRTRRLCYVELSCRVFGVDINKNLDVALGCHTGDVVVYSVTRGVFAGRYRPHSHFASTVGGQAQQQQQGPATPGTPHPSPHQHASVGSNGTPLLTPSSAVLRRELSRGSSTRMRSGGGGGGGGGGPSLQQPRIAASGSALSLHSVASSSCSSVQVSNTAASSVSSVCPAEAGAQVSSSSRPPPLALDSASIAALVRAKKSAITTVAWVEDTPSDAEDDTAGPEAAATPTLSSSSRGGGAAAPRQRAGSVLSATSQVSTVSCASSDSAESSVFSSASRSSSPLGQEVGGGGGGGGCAADVAGVEAESAEGVPTPPLQPQRGGPAAPAPEFSLIAGTESGVLYELRKLRSLQGLLADFCSAVVPGVSGAQQGGGQLQQPSNVMSPSSSSSSSASDTPKSVRSAGGGGGLRGFFQRKQGRAAAAGATGLLGGGGGAIPPLHEVDYLESGYLRAVNVSNYAAQQQQQQHRAGAATPASEALQAAASAAAGQGGGGAADGTAALAASRQVFGVPDPCDAVTSSCSVTVAPRRGRRAGGAGGVQGRRGQGERAEQQQGGAAGRDAAACRKTLIAVGSSEGAAYVLLRCAQRGVPRMRCVLGVQGRHGSVLCTALSSCGRFFAVGGDDDCVALYSLCGTAPVRVASLVGPENWVPCVGLHYSRGLRRLTVTACSLDGRLYIWCFDADSLADVAASAAATDASAVATPKTPMVQAAFMFDSSAGDGGGGGGRDAALESFVPLSRCARAFLGTSGPRCPEHDPVAVVDRMHDGSPLHEVSILPHQHIVSACAHGVTKLWEPEAVAV